MGEPKKPEKIKALKYYTATVVYTCISISTENKLANLTNPFQPKEKKWFDSQNQRVTLFYMHPDRIIEIFNGFKENTESRDTDSKNIQSKVEIQYPGIKQKFAENSYKLSVKGESMQDIDSINAALTDSPRNFLVNEVKGWDMETRLGSNLYELVRGIDQWAWELHDRGKVQNIKPTEIPNPKP